MKVWVVTRTDYNDDYKCRYGESWANSGILGVFNNHDSAYDCRYNDIKTLVNERIGDYDEDEILKCEGVYKYSEEKKNELEEEYECVDVYENYDDQKFLIVDYEGLADSLFEGHYVNKQFEWEVKEFAVKD